jgi:uncharacterized membrane protein
LLASGIACLALPLAVGVSLWLNFNRTFVFFHEVFFPQGNWQFSEASLLITTYPGHFWQAAGLLWMAAFLIIGAILILLSRFCGEFAPWSVTNN